MPRTKEQNEAIRAEKKQLIIDSALHLFAEKGYASTSINDIAQSANISKGLMYNYFKSKEDVLQSIWDGLVDEFSFMIDPNQDGEITNEEAENFIDKIFEMLITRREEMKLYFQISFQPEMLDFIQLKIDDSRRAERQEFIIKSFADRLPVADPANAYFSVVVFLKGLSMVLTYSETLFDTELLENYKKFLKTILFK
jgi:AcrR family transcriptional regulator